MGIKELRMGYFISMLVALFIGFTGGVVVMASSYNTNTALKLSNVMNSSMLDCVTQKIITKEQVHDIETVFFKHIEENFKHIKASHGDSYKENK